jgi:hypothetical protein
MTGVGIDPFTRGRFRREESRRQQNAEQGNDFPGREKMQHGAT